jgi:CheY-like chemotaxis protein
MGITSLAEDDPSSYAFDDYLHKISMSGSYMREAIDDILTLRQISRHQLVLNPTAINLDEFFDNIERMIRPFIVERGLLFVMDTSNINSISIIADPRCLQQIVLKMLHSAGSYTIKGGRIRLQARVLSYKNTSVEIELSAENRGMVIDKERLDILFKPNDYLEERLNKKIGDLDLSLLIMRSCLLAMGATSITAESDKQTGTRICVNLTVPLATEKDMLQQKDLTADYHGRRVLLVDDNEISLDISEKLLSNKGIEVTKARNGKEAVDIFSKEDGRFDLIIMDILMPVMDGLTATRMIRSMPNVEKAATIPIIALTVNAFREHFEESLWAGMNAHLVKPIEPGSLYKVLAKYLR